MGVSVGQVLRQGARRHGERLALVDVGSPADARRERTYAQLDRLACRRAAQLVARGVAAGDRVALLADNSLELVAAWFGAVYAGAAVVPLSISSSAEEVAFRVAHAGCGVLLHDASRAALASDAIVRAGVGCSAVSLTEVSGTAAAPLQGPLDREPEDTAMVLYTSGTTGKPKGAVISHASLSSHTASLAHASLALTGDDVGLCVLPIGHSYGARMAMLAPLLAGARVVLVPRFSAERTLQLMRDERVTWLPAVPTMYAAWAQTAAGAQPACLRLCLSAGAPLPDETCRRAEARLGCEVRQGYGLTEATFAAINAPPDARVLGSVGKPASGVTLRIVDELGEDVPAGQTGEVLVRGPNVMTHYLFDPEATQQAITSGFVHSGDLGRLDAEGRLFIVDRKKDLVIRGGYNVYPAEVEGVLAAHPSVAQVAVIGQPDAFYGEEIVAVVVLRQGSVLDVAALSDLARTHLSRTKHPRAYAVVDRMPLGPSGKVQKRVLRQWLAGGRLALTHAATR